MLDFAVNKINFKYTVVFLFLFFIKSFTLFHAIGICVECDVYFLRATYTLSYICVQNYKFFVNSSIINSQTFRIITLSHYTDSCHHPPSLVLKQHNMTAKTSTNRNSRALFFINNGISYTALQQFVLFLNTFSFCCRFQLCQSHTTLGWFASSSTFLCYCCFWFG